MWCVDLSAVDLEQQFLRVWSLAQAAPVHRVDLFVGTKLDRMPNVAHEAVKSLFDQCATGNWLWTSSADGRGCDALKVRLLSEVQARNSAEIGSVMGTAARCASSLMEASEALSQAIALVESGAGHEYLASEIRIAVESLGEVTGAVYTDDLLDRVFSRFCIGK
jgi:tRNA modification GTPase